MAVRRGVALGGGRDLLSAAARRARRGARPGHALGHPGAGGPARGAGRARALRRVPARDPARVAPARRRGRARPRGGRRAGALRRARTRPPPRRSIAATSRHGWRRTRPGRRRPPTRSCRCSRRAAACGCSWPAGSPRTAPAAASWGGGLWLPECAHAPWLDELLEEAGVRAACVDLTDVLGRGAQRSCGRCARRPGRCWRRSTARCWSWSGATPAIPRAARTATRTG